MSRSYRDLLGDSWNDLPPGVQRSLTAPLHAVGTLSIYRAKRGAAGMIARIIRLPEASSNSPSTLDLSETSGGLEWRRQFGMMEAVSLQIIRGDRLFEIAHPFEFELRMQVNDGAVEISQIGQSLFRIPTPRIFGPQVTGNISPGPDDMSWQVKVSIRHTWFGTISSYEGVMRAE